MWDKSHPCDKYSCYRGIKWKYSSCTIKLVTRWGWGVIFLLQPYSIFQRSFSKHHHTNVSTTRQNKQRCLILCTIVYNPNLYFHLQGTTKKFFIKIPHTCSNIYTFNNCPCIICVFCMYSYVCIMFANSAPIKLPLYIWNIEVWWCRNL
jgi:hypothetical protein